MYVLVTAPRRQYLVHVPVHQVHLAGWTRLHVEPNEILQVIPRHFDLLVAQWRVHELNSANDKVFLENSDEEGLTNMMAYFSW